jgi:hypothetical protein
MSNIFWHMRQNSEIRKAQNTADYAASKIDNISVSRDNTKQELEELTLACQAMWELLRDHIGFTDDHLKAKIHEIDARDGTIDGKIGAELIDCLHCGQKASTTKPRCVYCGHLLPSSHIMK